MEIGEENNMIKKPHLILAILIIAVSAVYLVGTSSDSQMGIQSKVSHIEKEWSMSGHADATAEAFVHWDEDGEIPGSCSKCHSTPGYVNFIESDGATISVSPGTTVECNACHSNPETGTIRDHSDVEFPSGTVVEGLGPEALCMECHQGRSSGSSVEEAIVRAGVDDDTSSSSLSFINIHYHIAAANQFGTVVGGGYEYAGMMYDARFSHVTGYNACNTCHNPHSLHVDLGPCNTCHSQNINGVFKPVTDPHDIRYYGSFVDYDGDGDMEEGMYWEIEGIKPVLYAAMQAYSKDVLMQPIGYDSDTYPYFFNDTNGNGVIDPDEANFGNRYTSFSPRLLRAAYNYQVALKDPNAFAHGGKYVIQLMYDSIIDLNSVMKMPAGTSGIRRASSAAQTSIDTEGLHRDDEGHFDGSTEAWRHWDEDGGVQTSCAKCHSATGLQEFVTMGTIAEEQPLANGMLCTTCHWGGPPSLTRIASVEFPSGAVEDLGDHSNYCLECHQGRASMYSIQSKIAGSEGPYSFTNIHYFPAAAVMFGTEVKGGFEYAGKLYVGQNPFPNHLGKFDTCVECHMGSMSEHKATDFTGKMHNVHKPDPRDCVGCHGYDISQPNPGADPAKFKFSGIRPASIPDLNGNGDYTESIEHEIKGLEADLYAAIQAQGNKIGVPVGYESHSYPYWFNDLNGNGVIDPDEATYSNGYSFTAKMLKAAYNLQMSLKEPHGFIHNPIYIGQLLVDSILDLGGENKYSWR